MQESRRRLTKKYRFGNLSEKDAEIVDEIYLHRNTQCLKGGDAHQFSEKIEAIEREIEKLDINSNVVKEYE